VQKTKENLRNFVKTTEKGEKQLKYNKNTLFILNILHNEYRRIFKKEVFYMFFYRGDCYNSSCNKKLPNTLREVFLYEKESS